MKLIEFLTEGYDAPLYHATNFSGAKGILRDGCIRAFYGDYVCVTRDKNLLFKDQLVQFVIDTPKVKHRYAIQPFDFFAGSENSRRDSEERIMTDSLPLTMVSSVMLMPPRGVPPLIAQVMHREGDEIARMAEAQGIEVIDKRPGRVGVSEADELLTEGRDAPLYHGTSLSAAIEILEDNALVGRTTFRFQGQNYTGLSTTRSPRMTHIEYDPHASVYRRSDDSVVAFEVFFILDQAKIAQTTKIIPMDYFKGDKAIGSVFGRDASDLRDRRSEAEELVATKRLPAAGNVMKIVVSQDALERANDGEIPRRRLDTLRGLAARLKIPVILRSFGDLGFSSTRTGYWDRSRRDTMVKHADKREYQLSTTFQLPAVLKLRTRWEQAGGAAMTDAEAQAAFSMDDMTYLYQLWFLMHNWRPQDLEKPLPAASLTKIFSLLKDVSPTNPAVFIPRPAVKKDK